MSKIIFGMDVKERWRKIKNYPYEISNLGKVKRSKSGRRTFIGKILRLRVSTGNYLYINLSKNGRQKTFLVHRLVAEAFLGPCPNEKEVNHKDGNKQNPYANNLEYVMPKENIKHAIELGLINNKGERHYRAKLTDDDVKKIRKLHRSGKYMQKEIAEKMGVTEVDVSRIIRGRNWRHVK